MSDEPFVFEEEDDYDPDEEGTAIEPYALFHEFGRSTKLTRQSGDERIISVDEDTICLGCMRLMVEHERDILRNLMNVTLVEHITLGRGFVHKLCNKNVEEAEVIRVE